jgi:hypothetical protein
MWTDKSSAGAAQSIASAWCHRHATWRQHHSNVWLRALETKKRQKSSLLKSLAVANLWHTELFEWMPSRTAIYTGKYSRHVFNKSTTFYQFWLSEQIPFGAMANWYTHVYTHAYCVEWSQMMCISTQEARRSGVKNCGVHLNKIFLCKST